MNSCRNCPLLCSSSIGRSGRLDRWDTRQRKDWMQGVGTERRYHPGMFGPPDKAACNHNSRFDTTRLHTALGPLHTVYSCHFDTVRWDSKCPRIRSRPKDKRTCCSGRPDRSSRRSNSDRSCSDRSRRRHTDRGRRRTASFLLGIRTSDLGKPQPPDTWALHSNRMPHFGSLGTPTDRHC